jgi:glutathione S-transferase
MIIHTNKEIHEKTHATVLDDIGILCEAYKEGLRLFQGPYLCGDHMTIGDIVIAPFIERMVVFKEF